MKTTKGDQLVYVIRDAIEYGMTIPDSELTEAEQYPLNEEYIKACIDKLAQIFDRDIVYDN